LREFISAAFLWKLRKRRTNLEDKTRTSRPRSAPLARPLIAGPRDGPALVFGNLNFSQTRGNNGTIRVEAFLCLCALVWASFVSSGMAASRPDERLPLAPQTVFPAYSFHCTQSALRSAYTAVYAAHTVCMRWSIQSLATLECKLCTGRKGSCAGLFQLGERPLCLCRKNVDRRAAATTGHRLMCSARISHLARPFWRHFSLANLLPPPASLLALGEARDCLPESVCLRVSVCLCCLGAALQQ